MKHLATFALVTVFGVLALAIRPGGDSMGANAAMAFSGPVASMEPICQTNACATGWLVAQERAINNAEDCRLISSNQEEVSGCRAYVLAALHDRLENGW